ncbi:replication protein [Pragia fontium]|uniref:replication protein n=1 Tax=Pragia fontium TaxID=82985 RepID=UPI000F70C045|nr:replication protein [Pragia fontium]VEJ54599.1 phage replication protein O, N-terminal domain [Pragia fontium]
MGNLAYDNVTPIRPDIKVVESRVANTDDGYTRLANELYEELIGANLTRNQAKVAHAICRKTYGYNKKMDRISDSQISKLTKLPRQKVNKAKNQLITMNVMISDGRMIGPNKDLSKWNLPECNQFGDSDTKTVTENVTKVVTAMSPKQGHTKDTITKDKKDNKNTLPEQVQVEGKTPSHENLVEKAFEEIFWIAGMVKSGKTKAKSAFKTQFKEYRKETSATPEQFASVLAQDIKSRLGKQFGFEKLHPTTYLNGKRWEDEKPQQGSEPTTNKSTITVSGSGYVFY